METMQKVVDALNANKNINYETKVELLEAIVDFHVRFAGVSLENLSDRLRNLGVSSSSLLYSSSICYVPTSNELVINRGLLSREETDKQHDMMKAVLSMITAKGNDYGFNSNELLNAINAGFREVLSTNLVGHDGEGFFSDEEYLVNLIFTKEDFDLLFDAFINGKPDEVIKRLLEKCNDMYKIKAFLEQANNNMMTRPRTKTSMLAGLIQKAGVMFDVNKDYLCKPLTVSQFSDNVYVDIDVLEVFVKDQYEEWTRGR